VKLYEIDEQIASLIDEDGCITDPEAWDKLNMERQDKIESVALWIKNLRADVEAYKSEIKSFEERKKSAENKIEGLTNWLEYALDGEKLKTDKVQVSYRKSDRVEIAEDAQIPEQFLKITSTPNKAEIKKYLKQGYSIEGVTLEEKRNMTIK